MLDRVTIVCFLASYTTALGLELLYQFRPRQVVRWLALAFGAAGLTAQTIFLAVQRPPLIWQYGWMLFLAWISGHLLPDRFAPSSPPVLGPIRAAAGARPRRTRRGVRAGRSVRGENLLPIRDAWGAIHAGLLLLAAVGAMRRLSRQLHVSGSGASAPAKTLPGQGLRLWSLERLEAMNRRAIVLAFPLLTAGMVLGIVLMLQDHLPGWTDPRLLASSVLWLTFAVLLYLRYGYHLRGRQVALLTIVTFALLVGCLVLSHPVGQGGDR